jgi:hypothetical protein
MTAERRGLFVFRTSDDGTKCARDCVHHEEAMYDDGTVAMAMCRAFGFDELRWGDDGEPARHPDCIAAERAERAEEGIAGMAVVHFFDLARMYEIETLERFIADNVAAERDAALAKLAEVAARSMWPDDDSLPARLTVGMLGEYTRLDIQWRSLVRKADDAERDLATALAKLAEVEAARDMAAERDFALAIEALRKQLATRTEALQTANGTTEYWRDEAEAARVERDRRPEITPEDAKAWLSGNDDDSDVADALRTHAGKAVG